MTYGKAKVLSIRVISMMYLYHKRICYDKYENYKVVMLKLMEMETINKNKIALYLFNSINKANK